jgi:hypothetical protein
VSLGRGLRGDWKDRVMAEARSAQNGNALRRGRARVSLLGLLAIATLISMGAFAGVASAAVSNVTVDNTSVTTAASAQTVYTVNFKTSSSGALASGNTITIAFPTGTDLTRIFAGKVVDVSTGGNTVGTSCFHSAAGTPPAETCSIAPGSAVGNGDVVSVTLDDVVNTNSAGTQSATVTTTNDAAGATSAGTFSVVAASTVSQVSADNSSVTTGRVRRRYTR